MVGIEAQGVCMCLACLEVPAQDVSCLGSTFLGVCAQIVHIVAVFSPRAGLDLSRGIDCFGWMGTDSLRLWRVWPTKSGALFALALLFEETEASGERDV